MIHGQTVFFDRILHQMHAGTILSDIEGTEKGLQYSFCIEDSTDNDFNDYFISVVAWHKKN